MKKHPTGRSVRTRLTLETMEDRLVPATISVADATMNEIASSSAFVSAGSGGLDAPQGITLGPDGSLYVACNGGAVRRYNGSTGAFINTFVSQGSGGLSGTKLFGLAFGPDGNLYVASPGSNQVLEYNGSTGAFIKAFVAAGSGGLNTPVCVMFGPDGNLYVSSNDSNALLRYQGPLTANPGSPLPAPNQSGATFIAPSSGGLFQAHDAVFGPDGNLYLDGGQTPGILRFSGSTGAFLDTFVPNLYGRGMAFDQDGRLYVCDQTDAVHRFDAQGDSLGDVLVNSVSATLGHPRSVTFDAQGALLISCYDMDKIVRYDGGVVVSLDAASATPVSVSYATADGSAAAATKYYSQTGTVTFNPGQTVKRILLATRDNPDAEPSQTFSVQLSNATGGATIGAGAGTVTITDDDSMRHLSIADATAIEGGHTAHYRGAFVQGIAGNASNNPVTFGPDGNLYTTAIGTNAIARYNGTTGAFIDNFIADDGHIKLPRAIVFRAGYIYVSSILTTEVIRYNATTGVFVDVFVTAGSGGLSAAEEMSFGRDANNDGIGELYVSSEGTNRVLRYDGVTGQPLGTYMAAGSGGLSAPRGLTFDSTNTYLYVASNGSSQILKYNATSGAFVGVAGSAGLSGPCGVRIGTDGLLYVANQGNSRIVRFTTGGAYVDDFVPAGSGGLDSPSWMTFGPDGDLYVTSKISQIMRFGTENEALFTVTNTTPSTLPLTVNYSTADGSAIAGSDYMAVSGTLTFAPGVTSELIRVPILDDAVAESTESFSINLSNATGGVITDGQGIATIQDNDATKFFVVNDAATDQTYRYGAPGNALGNSSLANGDTGPRGVATTAAGTTVWVADANGKVYVYNPSGGLLGSWTAGSLPANFQVEGITTNGADIWLLDNKQDKVFKYTGAASRLSGSQNAASSFTLNSSNSNGKGIVTDGASFWVVNDASTDKVFKYTLSGSLLGSWPIDSANASPTGLTINPASVSDIWIVDNGTDKVYQYTAAAGRTSGSQSAAATFALAAGNTNPQDIADPPPATLATAKSVVEDHAAHTPLIRIGHGPRRVDISDFGFFSQAYLNPLNYNAALDFNNDGRIDISDFGQFSVRFFTTLP